MPRLAQARGLLEAKDLAGAVGIYEEVLAAAGDRPDVLVTISGDLGTFGHVVQIVELVAPRYDAQRHGPATGLNLLQAYIAVRDPGAAQHVLDILFDLQRPELEERLYGFSNVIAELFAHPASPASQLSSNGEAPVEAPHVELVSFTRPIWFYGLEAMEEALFPAKPERVRRVAFAQLALLGEPNLDAAMLQPEDELGRLSRALPLWLAETFHVSPHYAASAVVGLHNSGGVKRPFLFSTEWTSENLTQLVNTSSDPLDYVITGALRHKAGDYELVLRIWEVKKFRERKQFTARWAPADAGQALAKLHEQVRSFMEWSAAPGGLTYAVPADPRAWLEVLGAGAGLFLATKGLVPRELLPPTAPVFAALAPQTAGSPSASLAWLTLRDRVKALGDEPPPAATVLSTDPLVSGAREILG
ncbi:MAG: hypothetical protein RL324_989 [Verrucomicrobiota bacterium]|jgi:hypothetical protein